MFDVRKQLNRVKRIIEYVERDFACLQPSRAFLELNVTSRERLYA